MKTGTKIGIGLGVLAAIVAAAVGYMMVAMSPPSDLDLAREKPSAKGLYIVAVAPETEPFERNTLHGWTATVKTADGNPVEGAEITVDGGMPQHAHGLPTAPAVTASLGEGRYRIEGVRFNMSGWWEFKLKIKAAAGEDDVTFNLDL
jgi:hypothetical protein